MIHTSNYEFSNNGFYNILYSITIISKFYDKNMAKISHFHKLEYKIPELLNQIHVIMTFHVERKCQSRQSIVLSRIFQCWAFELPSKIKSNIGTPSSKYSDQNLRLWWKVLSSRSKNYTSFIFIAQYRSVHCFLTNLLSMNVQIMTAVQI